MAGFKNVAVTTGRSGRFERLLMLVAVLLVFGACGGSDSAGIDAGGDASLDAGSDVGIDAASDVGGDATSDVSLDAASDVSVDATNDVSLDAADADPDEPETAGIRGTVTYDGEQQGAITVAAFIEDPRESEDWSPVASDSAGSSQASAEFPWDYELTDLEPGTYYLVAFFDVGADSGSTPDAREDIVELYDTTIEIAAGEVAIVGFALTDPVLGDGQVSGVVDGHASMEGDVIVGAYANWPPMDMGLPDCYAEYADVDVPFTYELDCLAEGDWHIAALFFTADSDGLSAPAFTTTYEHNPVEISMETKVYENIDMEFSIGPGEVSGVISANVPASGSIVVGLYETFSPEDPGTPVHYQTFYVGEGGSSFPLDYDLGDLPLGTYYLAASIDLDALEFETADAFAIYEHNPLVIDAGNLVIDDADLEFDVDAGRISGQVHYEGPAEGAVQVGLYESFPLEDDAMPVEMVEFDTTQSGFPLDFEFAQVPEGSYELAALFDTDASGFDDPDQVALYDDGPLIIDDTTVSSTGLSLSFPSGLSGTISYSGTKNGDLLVGLYPAGSLMPEQGSLPFDSDVISFIEDDTEFPASYAFNFVPDGFYVLLAGFDIGGDDISLPERLTYFDDGASLVVIDGEIRDSGGDAITVADLELPSGPGQLTGSIEAFELGTGSSVVTVYPTGSDLPAAMQVFPGGGPHAYDFEELPEGTWRVVGGFDLDASSPFAPEILSDPFYVSLTEPDSLDEDVPDIIFGDDRCPVHCNEMSDLCSGVYTDPQECRSVCTDFPQGNEGDVSGDTFECRDTWLQLGFDGAVSVSDACDNAAPESDECVDQISQDCNDYCDAMSMGCTGVYPSIDECHSVCADFEEGNEGDLSGDTRQCRESWFLLGFEGQISTSEACGNAGPDSDECVD